MPPGKTKRPKPEDKNSEEYKLYRQERHERKAERSARRHKKTESLAVIDNASRDAASEYSSDSEDDSVRFRGPPGGRPPRSGSPVRIRTDSSVSSVSSASGGGPMKNRGGTSFYGDGGAGYNPTGSTYAPTPVPQNRPYNALPGNYSPVSPLSPPQSPAVLQQNYVNPQHAPLGSIPAQGQAHYTSPPLRPQPFGGQYGQNVPGRFPVSQYNGLPLRPPPGFGPYPTQPPPGLLPYPQHVPGYGILPQPGYGPGMFPTQAHSAPGPVPQYAYNQQQPSSGLPPISPLPSSQPTQVQYGFPVSAPAAVPPPLPPRPALSPIPGPAPIPGFGAGAGLFPPGETPEQFNNPDYYAETASITAPSMGSFLNTGGNDNCGGGGGGGASNEEAYGRPPVSPSGHKPSDSLSVPDLGSLTLGGGHPQPSPLLGPYYGTYQSISPLPSPIMAASSGSPMFHASGSIGIGSHTISGAFSLGPPAFSSSSISSSSPQPPMPIPMPTIASHKHSHHQRSRSDYDPKPDAMAIITALMAKDQPLIEPIIKIIPTLSPSQLHSIRREYRKVFDGLSLSHHVKSRFGNDAFAKVVFVTTLGPYESEAWFSNIWYQNPETRNELLIESLMGKSNREIRKIGEAYKDVKYDDSLGKAVRAVLPDNKFRIAVLLQLEGIRMEEDLPIEEKKLQDDVSRLARILDGRKGKGESVMIELIVMRSDKHLRHLMALYREIHRKDLVKAIRKHSENLLGEAFLHILNGILNKPLRDAKLLNQAICHIREDMLTSRAVRTHWDAHHLQRVQRAYRKKFDAEVYEKIAEKFDGPYGEFLYCMMRGNEQY